MNFSINSLILSHLSTSPLICNSFNTGLSNLNFKKLKISKSFSPFLFSDSSALRTISFSKSSFSHTLTQSIYISNKSFREKVFQGQTFRTKAKKLEFDFCKFVDNRAQTASGGALYTTVPTFITSCQFNNCAANEGGAIFASNELYIKHTTFTIIQALERNGCIQYEGNYNTNINYTSFHDCLAKQFAAFSKYLGKYNVVKMTNISSMFATIVTAGFEIGLCTGKVIFTTVSNNTAGTKNTGIAIYNSHQFIIESCLFLHLNPKSTHKQGSAIWCDGNELILTVMKSTFYKCHGVKGKVICVQNSTTVTVYRCCFDVSRKEAVSKSVVVDTFSTFNDSRCNLEMAELYDDTKIEDTTWMGYAIILFFMFGSLIYANGSRIQHALKRSHKKKGSIQKSQ